MAGGAGEEAAVAALGAVTDLQMSRRNRSASSA